MTLLGFYIMCMAFVIASSCIMSDTIAEAIKCIIVFGLFLAMVLIGAWLMEAGSY